MNKNTPPHWLSWNAGSVSHADLDHVCIYIYNPFYSDHVCKTYMIASVLLIESHIYYNCSLGFEVWQDIVSDVYSLRFVSSLHVHIHHM